MLRILLATIVAVGLATATVPASAKSPILGNAKVSLVSKDEAKDVTAKGVNAAYYLYQGLNYASTGIYYAGLSQYYNYYYGYAYYAYSAYSYTQAGANYFYYAYYYANS